MKTQIVRFFTRDFYPNNLQEINKFITGYGLDFKRCKYSSFGSCYFVEVIGEFKEDEKLKVIDTLPSKFNWNV